VSETKVLNVAVLVRADTRPKDLSRLLDVAFEGCDAVLQFVVEGHGWAVDTDGTEAALMRSLVENAVSDLENPPNGHDLGTER
jgi:hypothetical protein